MRKNLSKTWFHLNLISIGFTPLLVIILNFPLTSELNVRMIDNERVEHFSNLNTNPGEVKKRVKRVIWYSNRRFIMPRGSYIIISPRLQLPVIRQPPTGLNADMQVSMQFFMMFDQLGWTSERHPWPPNYPFGLNQPMNGTKNVSRSFSFNSAEEKARKKKSILSLPSPENVHGGERAFLFPRIEKMLSSFGLEGRPCLLRAVCEIHQVPLVDGYGLFGEFITLFFTVSQSIYAESHLPQYLKSEIAGKNGDCIEYFKSCPKSIFSTSDSKRHFM